MPLTLEQKRRLIQSHGLNPDEYDVDASEENIVPLPPKAPQPSGDVTTTVNLPQPSSPAPSVLDTARRGATQSLLPTAAGLGATAATLALMPEPVVTKIGALGTGIAALLAGTAGSIGASKIQEKVVPKDVQDSMFLRPEDMEKNKYTAILSGLAPSLLAFKPSLQDIPELIGGVKALPRVATAGSSALTTPQISALINAGANVLPSAGMYGYDVATGNREFNLGELAAESLPGALLTRPTGIGRALGFHSPEMPPKVTPEKPAIISEKTPEPTSPKIEPKAFLPEETLSTLLERQRISQAAEEPVPVGRAETRRRLEEEKLQAEELANQERRAKALKDADYRRMEAEIEIENQKVLATELEAQRLKAENERRKLDLAVGGKQGFGEETPIAERLTTKVEANRLNQPEVLPKINQGVELNKAKAAKQTQKELEAPLTEAEQIQEDYDTGKRYSKESDLPPLDRTPIESLPAESRSKIKKEIERIARLRGQRVTYVDSLKDPATGKEILGQYDPKTKSFKLNKALYAGDTGPHETAHGRILDMLESTSEKDSGLILRGLEFSDPKGRKFKTVEDYKKLPISEQLAIEERFTKSVGPEGYRRQRQELFGRKRERFTEWVKQIGNHLKVKSGAEDSDALFQHFIERQMFDAPDAARVEMSGVTPAVKMGDVEKTEKKKETVDDIAFKKRKSEESNLPDWAREQMIREGLDPKRTFNDIDLQNKSVRDAINSDPTLTEKEKNNLLTKGSRNSEESDLPSTEDSNPEATLPRRIFSSATQAVRNLGGETADHVASQSEKYFAKKSLYEGKYSNTIQAEIASYPKSVRDTVDQYGREMHNRGESDVTLSPEEQSLYDSVREYLVKVADENTAREIKKDPNYWPAILDSRVASVWSKAPNSIEGKYFQREWMNHAQEQVDKGRAEYTHKELKKILDDYMAAVSSSGRESSLEFGALRKAAGLGLPITMQDNNLLSRFGRYGKRVAKDMAFRESVESDPTMRYMLRIKDDEGVTLTEPPSLPNGNQADSKIRGTEQLNNIQKFMYEEFQNNSNPRLQAFSRLVNSALLGTATGIRDFVTSPLNISTVIGPRNSAALVEGLKYIKEGVKDSFNYGARRIKMNELEFGSAAHPDTLTKWFNEVADGFRKYSGRESLEQGSRIYMWGVAKAATLAEFGRASNGHETSLNWLKKYGNTVDNLSEYIGKTGADIPEDVINRIAKNIVDRAAGTYDARGLPTSVMEGPFAPFFSLSRWSIEKANTIVEDVLIPARKGNFAPLLTYGLGSFLTGSAIQELNKLMSSGKEGVEPTLKEASVANEQQVRAVINLLQLGSFGGIIGDLMKSSTEAYAGHLPRGLSFPLADFVSETLGQNLADYFAALQSGEDKIEASLGLTERVLTSSIQSLRLLSYATWNKDEVDRKNAYRDYRLWQELSGRKSPESTIQRPNEFLNKREKEFKRAKTGEDIEATFPKAIESVIEKAGGNPLELIDGFKRLKANSYQTWPTEPVEQVAYYEYLKQVQGEEKAAQSFMDFMQQRELNKIKNRMIPNLMGKAE